MTLQHPGIDSSLWKRDFLHMYNYTLTEDGKFACKHCTSVFIKQSNASRDVQESNLKNSAMAK